MSYITKSQIEEPILMTYQYGSRVYGTHTKESDYDFIVIVKSDEDIHYSVHFVNSDFTIYSESLFIKRIQEHKVDALECIFQNKSDPYRKHFKLDKEKLRREFSSVSSNSYVKCKKKLGQGDYYIGKKSLFHSIRILGFGIQIALAGRIVNYSAYNYYHGRIFSMTTTDWDVYDKIFKPIYNDRKSSFKRLAPLGKGKQP